MSPHHLVQSVCVVSVIVEKDDFFSVATATAAAPAPVGASTPHPSTQHRTFAWDTQARVTFDHTNEFLKNILKEKCLAGSALIFVVEEFDALCNARQMLLYNLLDCMQVSKFL